ncbi:hypothetical protein SAMN06297280_2602 [Arsukibacterium tuosuense]|uniref:Uncharacterized protein n=1 Tax=Arsukibacterium tuosuense TaxID=1323745 RepID=A0A285J1Y3_9GAMM|nr:hypothetical protein [Arsukibacterium tuosuense]SNY54228.1 hypothetical protein SAMN06297280_2602 [Arsukibacterium tuosuense]
MQKNDSLYTETTYAAWLADARQTDSNQQIVQKIFPADNTAVSFNKISYATCKLLSEHFAEQE